MKAIIGISDWEQTKRELIDLGKRVDAGQLVAEADYHLDFANAEQLLSELPPKRLETLRAVKGSGPTSIYAVAKRLGRNYSNVHSDVARLIELGLVEKDSSGRVTVPWDDVVVRVDASLMAAA